MGHDPPPEERPDGPDFGTRQSEFAEKLPAPPIASPIAGKDDGMPWRPMIAVLPERAGKDAVNSAENGRRMLADDSTLHGWSRETGRPLSSTLRSLRLDFIATAPAGDGNR